MWTVLSVWLIFREILKLKKHNLISHDLLETEPDPVYDAVIMNPPFSEECEHIKKAFEFVRPGGSLTAICSPRRPVEGNAQIYTVSRLACRHTHSFSKPSDGKFEKTGTNTIILHMRKAA